MKSDGSIGKQLERQAQQKRIIIKGKQKAGMSKEEAITSFNKSHIDLGNSTEKPGLAKARI
jgi:hypothetical protein